MPVLDSSSLFTALVERSSPVTNATALQVVCAWPVSGQYGPGSRVLYYVLVAACVFGRKENWLKGACLAAGLLLPAVAALHGILLAALHVEGAVDMDLYGAFQLCAIGILAAPATVRLSRTYFFDPGRNLIFVWTILILAGLLSLTVEFFRIKTTPCNVDAHGNPVFYTARNFTYDPEANDMCGLTCHVQGGKSVPFSPLRQQAANNIYVIPAPDKLTFGTATLLAAACCIPAILSLVSMWNKILQINWKTRFGNQREEEINEPIEGTNGATVAKIRGVNALVSTFLSAVEYPIFGGAVLAILIMGERNFFSHQVDFQTEPIQSVGQWAPIVGTGLAVLGSLYVLLAGGGNMFESKPEEKDEKSSSQHHCNCVHESVTRPDSASSHSVATPSEPELMQRITTKRSTLSRMVPTMSRSTDDTGNQDAGNRRKVASALAAFGEYIGNAAPDRFDDSDFKHGKAVGYPEVPGEENRNPELRRFREQYNPSRDQDGNVTPLSRVPSRAPSFVSTEARGSMERSTTLPASPRSPHERISFDLGTPDSPTPGMSGSVPRARRDTLEVPAPVHQSHHHHRRGSLSGSPIVNVSGIPNGPGSPSIVVSSEPESYISEPEEPQGLGISTPSVSEPSTPPIVVAPPKS